MPAAPLLSCVTLTVYCHSRVHLILPNIETTIPSSCSFNEVQMSQSITQSV